MIPAPCIAGQSIIKTPESLLLGHFLGESPLDFEAGIEIFLRRSFGHLLSGPKRQQLLHLIYIQNLCLAGDHINWRGDFFPGEEHVR